MNDRSSKEAKAFDERNQLIDETYRSHLSDLIGAIRKQFGSGPPEPEDVAHEAFRRVLEKVDLQTVGNLRGLLWRISRNLILDAKRAEQSRANYDYEVEQIFFPLRGSHSSPENVVLARRQLVELNGLLREMPDRRRWVFLARRLEGMTLDEIARLLNISRSAVAAHISRADKQINELLLGDEDE